MLSLFKVPSLCIGLSFCLSLNIGRGFSPFKIEPSIDIEERYISIYYPFIAPPVTLAIIF